MRGAVNGFRRRLDRFVERQLSDDVIRDWSFRWARFVLMRRKPTIIGVTGSAGKTTTTEAIGAVLRHPAAREHVGEVRTTTNNMNNYVGLPLVVLGYENWVKTRRERAAFLLAAPWRALRAALSRHYPRVLVLEYGTDRSGYILPMVQLAPPRIAVITTVGPAHLAGMGSVAGVAREKGLLVEHADPRGVAVLGDGHAYVDQIAARAAGRVVVVSGRGVELAEQIARVVAKELGVPAGPATEALARFKPPKSRLDRLHVGDIQIIDDSYNANPLSMTLGLDTLRSEAPAGSRKVAVLGTMAELGEDAARYHEEIGRYARQAADLVVGVGELGRLYAPNHWFADSTECAERIDTLVAPGDTILIKASASVGLGEVVERLTSGAPVAGG
jgi:UDP-N-acetylmuramoyl-tripeptide--D-alanyl-D-alanine ligase